MKPQFSVVICTYNRCRLLEQALESLAGQSISRSAFEIIVVDNNSTDDIASIVQQIEKKYPGLHLVRTVEKNQGLSHARNAGFSLAQGRYVAYLDDDARAPQHWLQRAADILKIQQPQPDALGGPENAMFEGTPPPWYKDSYGAVTTAVMGNHPRYLREEESFTGSNMIIRKELLSASGGFRTHLGMRGNDLAAHEETEFFLRLWKQSNDRVFFYYDPDLFILHTVSKNKQTVSYLLKRAFAGGQSWYRRERNPLLLRKLKEIGGAVGYAVWYSIVALRFLFSYPYYQQWLVERGKYVAFGLGYLTAGLRIPIRIKQDIISL